MSDSDDSTPRTAFSSADPPRNFTLDVGARIRAMTIGAPAYAARKKRIEDLDAANVAALVTLHDQLAARGHDAASVRAALHDKAHAIDLKRLNSLVEAHNRYYPIEANLPVDPRTGDYLIYGQSWAPEKPWTASRIVEGALAIIAARDAD
ncbi:MAG TPA: hypothetical protein VLT33_09860 [Labilithrix sp.]|nr:hypothetical protein [Labilithrix sp.]